MNKIKKFGLVLAALIGGIVILTTGIHLLSVTPEPLARAQLGRFDEPNFFRDGRYQFEEEIRQLQQNQQQPAPLLTVNDGMVQWQPVSSEAGDFTIWAPLGVLSDETETLDTAEGTWSFHVLGSQTAVGRFVVAYANAPASANASTLLDIQTALAAVTNFTLRSDRVQNLDNAPGREMRLEGPDKALTLRLVLANQRVYVLGTEQSLGAEFPDATNSFLNSFRLLS